MCAVPFPGLHRDDLDLKKLTRIQKRLKQRIPTGFDRHAKPPPLARQTLDEICHEHPPSPWLEREQNKQTSALQLGTLGGGNHFLEVRRGAWLALVTPLLVVHLSLVQLGNRVCRTDLCSLGLQATVALYLLLVRLRTMCAEQSSAVSVTR